MNSVAPVLGYVKCELDDAPFAHPHAGLQRHAPLCHVIEALLENPQFPLPFQHGSFLLGEQVALVADEPTHQHAGELEEQLRPVGA